jgi:hypothetical protein
MNDSMQTLDIISCLWRSSSPAKRFSLVVVEPGFQEVACGSGPQAPVTVVQLVVVELSQLMVDVRSILADERVKNAMGIHSRTFYCSVLNSEGFPLGQYGNSPSYTVWNRPFR